MGLLDSLEGMAAQSMEGSGNNEAKVAGGLMQALQEHPGGIGAVMDNFRNNGLGDQVAAMQNGQTPAITPDQVETGLQGTGLIESAAARAGVPPEIAKQVISTVLPMVMAHFAQNGQTPSQDVIGGLLAKVL